MKTPINRNPPTLEEMDKSEADFKRVEARFAKAHRIALGAMLEAWQDSEHLSLIQRITDCIFVLVDKLGSVTSIRQWESEFAPATGGDATKIGQEIPLTIPGLIEDDLFLSLQWNETKQLTEVYITGANASQFRYLEPKVTIAFENEEMEYFVFDDIDQKVWELKLRESRIRSVSIEYRGLDNPENG